MFKKISIILLTVVLISIAPNSLPKNWAFASTYNSATQNKNLSTTEKEFIQELKENNVKSDEEIEDTLQDVVGTEQKTKKEIDKRLENTTILPETSSLDESTKTLDLDEYMQDNIKNGNFKVEEINENVNVIFTNEDTFFVEILTVENPDVLKEENDTLSNIPVLGSVIKAIGPKTASAKTKYTGSVSKKYVAYSWVGIPLWEVYTKGEFKYTGKSVTAYWKDGYVKKRWGGVAWQVDNYGEGTTRNAKGTSATVFTRFNAHYGIEYSGVGIVLQYKDVRNEITCNKNGKISKSTTIR
ncbi:hypothetical protein [Bacillus altitudinis]|uniref:hypothetical protein n=1 Tax=Bacillus altitudinis TaxID=293387 RepID=UPI003F555758